MAEPWAWSLITLRGQGKEINKHEDTVTTGIGRPWKEKKNDSIRRRSRKSQWTNDGMILISSTPMRQRSEKGTSEYCRNFYSNWIHGELKHRGTSISRCIFLRKRSRTSQDWTDQTNRKGLEKWKDEAQVQNGQKTVTSELPPSDPRTGALPRKEAS